MKNAYFAFKNRQNAHFLKKKSLKNLVIQKKVVPLHPHSEECSLLRGITAEIAQLVEHNLAKVGVAGPSPVFRSNSPGGGMVDAHVSGACVERCAGSSPVLGTMFKLA